MTLQEKIDNIKVKNLLTADNILDKKTIQICLIHFELTVKDIHTIRTIDKEFYEILKQFFRYKIANLIELSIQMPRQLQQMLVLIKAQEEFFDKLFQEETTATIKMPEIHIKPSHNTTETTKTGIDITKIITE